MLDIYRWRLGEPRVVPTFSPWHTNMKSSIDDMLQCAFGKLAFSQIMQKATLTSTLFESQLNSSHLSNLQPDTAEIFSFCVCVLLFVVVGLHNHLFLCQFFENLAQNTILTPNCVTDLWMNMSHVLGWRFPEDILIQVLSQVTSVPLLLKFGRVCD